MRAAVHLDLIERIIWIKVVDGPITDVSETHHIRPRQAQVDEVVIRVVNGETRLITAHGGILLKTGRVSQEQRGKRAWSTHDDVIAAFPEWVRKLWREAPAGVTEWVIDA